MIDVGDDVGTRDVADEATGVDMRSVAVDAGTRDIIVDVGMRDGDRALHESSVFENTKIKTKNTHIDRTK